MMGGQRSVAFVIACWLAAGCELTSLAGETSAIACRDNRENDGDDFTDCDDSDCWVYAHCRNRGVRPPDAGSPFVPPWMYDSGPPGLGEPQPPAVTDASGGMTSDGSIDLDGEVDGKVDADAPPPPCEDCPEGMCRDGVCEPPESLRTYRVINLRVIVPRSKELLPSPTWCFDSSAACDGLFGCCDPDPILTMFVDGATVAAVAAQNTVDNTWAEPNIDVELRVGSMIEFELRDDDSMDEEAVADAEPDAVFRCFTVAAEEHLGATAPLTCVPEQSFFAPGEASVGVTARLVEKPAAAP